MTTRIAVPPAPYFEDLEVGATVEDAPVVTLTEGTAAVHQSILGWRLRLALDRGLARAVTGEDGLLAHPSLVCDVAIGQSTAVTQRVRANLFYRGLVLLRPVRIGDALRTTTTVEALRENRRREGRPATGLAELHMRTVDQHDRPVLDFRRCAMLPLRPDAPPTGRQDAVDAVPEDLDEAALRAVTTGWDLAAFRAASPHGAHAADLREGERIEVVGGDVVSSAPELARLGMNVALVHHDRRGTGARPPRRLVYGGHTIGLAGAQLGRALPNLVTIVGWRRCDHVGPVFEDDTLRSVVTIGASTPLADGGALVELHVDVTADPLDDDAGGEPRHVLAWDLIGVMA
ncbi:MaoC family dehydratase [Patulibacter brassicae]|uniref:MaoC family dehydratase n=1 Tax=Patulibacter brassicae TaxID=1705717 RepID=A0ABU4VQ23_9ACTN|nr:MaoC family dehydratase [Patulibacter brassicae]MDX8153734.1 MaoC family dehydratase [Patulibacter brassicae]